MKTRQRLHRDPDPRLRRSLAVALLCCAVLVVGLLVVVGLRVQQVHLAYQLDALRGERTRVEVLLRQLEIEVATLRSPGRVETRARQLGMTVPGREQVRHAREFVPGGSGGLASARTVSASVIR
ncbi:MAG: cell division protein FtsL [Candidatus Rokubacteria bacterium]|nr:cell division protein FtsL [Candidatus Rokubacteria bacterium]